MVQFTFTYQENIKKVLSHIVTVHNGGYGFGTGMIWREDGTILTNNHVAANDRPIVSLYDGQVVEGTVVKRAPEIDIAFIKIPANRVKPVQAYKGNVRSGELVFAVGHPLGQMNSVSAGIVSGVMQLETKDGQRKFPVIRSDVVLLPGNSGGPLVNASGDVLGINTMIIGGDQGFAVPISLAEEILPQTNTEG